MILILEQETLVSKIEYWRTYGISRHIKEENSFIMTQKTEIAHMFEASLSRLSIKFQEACREKRSMISILATFQIATEI